MNDFAELFGCADRDAMAVMTGADLLHRVGQCFGGACHLLGQVKGQPAAGKQREYGEQQHEQKICAADTIAPAEELPVAFRPERMVPTVRANPAGIGRATTTRLDEGVAEVPST